MIKATPEIPAAGYDLSRHQNAEGRTQPPTAKYVIDSSHESSEQPVMIGDIFLVRSAWVSRPFLSGKTGKRLL
jgi:hypothetical protein